MSKSRSPGGRAAGRMPGGENRPSPVEEDAAGGGGDGPKKFSFFDPAEINRRGGDGPSLPVAHSSSGEDSIDASAASASAASEGGHSNATERAANTGGTSAVAPSSGGSVDASSSSSEAAAARGPLRTDAKYEEGASELFMLVEAGKWEEGIARSKSDPHEAKIWITSSGTQNTVFSWSVWKRLPLHEACRRQPPPVMVYALLNAHPESAEATSQFGELPLHAAVRCGACAEVVNCLIAANAQGVFQRDNSGCTPLDILNGTGKMIDHDAVVDTLKRTMAILRREEEEWDAKTTKMETKHRREMAQRRRECERVVSKKNAEIDHLRMQVTQEKLATTNLASKVIQTEKVVESAVSKEKRLQEKLKKTDEELASTKVSNYQRKTKIKELDDVIRQDLKTIRELDQRVTLLSNQLTSICADEEEFVVTTVAKAEADLKALVEGQIHLFNETDRRRDQLRSRVGKLGLTLPPKKFPQLVQPPSEEEEEEEFVDEHDNSEVAEKALAAAMDYVTADSEHDDVEDFE